MNVDIVVEGGAQGSGTRVTELQRAAGVAVHEHRLDGDGLRPVLGNDFRDGLEDQPEPLGKRADMALHGTTGNISGAVATKVENSESGNTGPGVDTEYAKFIRHRHIHNCDNTSSGMSALL